MEDPKLPDSTGLPKENAGAEPVKPSANETPDLEAELKARDERIAKLEQDRSNYRTGMLKYKKLAEENPDDKSLDEERVKQMIREEMLNTEIAQENKAKDDIIKKALKENAELKTALKNKAQVSNMPGGSSQPQDDIKIEALTPEQKAYFQEVSGQTGIPAEKLEKQFLENWKKQEKK